ncbi:MAG TPA: MauE/DoxX family redox-associated membrane protein [Phycisphaerales bacterium]|nr:MauE/DoxX family redox-associated membrane protein [Phycisphaerales bacterium]
MTRADATGHAGREPAVDTGGPPGRSGGAVWPWVALVLRLALAAVFLLAAWMKLRPSPRALAPSGPSDFAGAIKAFRLGLPDWGIRLATSAVPWTEVICGLLLIVGLWTRAAATVAAALLIGFTGLVISALVRGLNVKCGCFGDRGLICEGAVDTCKVFENLLLVSLAVAVAMTTRHVLALDRALARRAPGA